MTPQHVTVRDLVKTYREAGRRHQVLRGVALDIAQGECVALVGRSGSGKSTLLHLLAGIDVADAGRIALDGRDVGGLPEPERTLFRRRHVGLVFQFFNLIPTLSVMENLLLPLELCGVARDEAERRAQELLAAIGLAARADSHPEDLSGGEQQRVALARAVIHRPTLLLADEPTGNLDEETGAVVLSLLDRLVRGQHLTLLIATHSPDVAAFADRVLVLHDGRLQPAS